MYVNFQGLKHNSKMFRGVFAKLLGASYFLDFMNYFSKEKSCGIGPRSHRPGPWFWLMSPRHSRSLSTVDSLICGSDYIKMKGYRQSNPDPPSTSGRLTSNPADRGDA
jgi:hypothetical protein